MPKRKTQLMTLKPKKSLRTKAMNYRALIKAIHSAHQEMQGHAAAAVNQTLFLRNWIVGAYIVEYEQGGTDRAKYGTRLLERLAPDLAAQGG